MNLFPEKAKIKKSGNFLGVKNVNNNNKKGKK